MSTIVSHFFISFLSILLQRTRERKNFCKDSWLRTVDPLWKLLRRPSSTFVCSINIELGKTFLYKSVLTFNLRVWYLQSWKIIIGSMNQLWLFSYKTVVLNCRCHVFVFFNLPPPCYWRAKLSFCEDELLPFSVLYFVLHYPPPVSLLRNCEVEELFQQ